MRAQGEGSHHKPRREASGEASPAGISDLQPPDCEYKRLLLKPPASGSLLRQPQRTETGGLQMPGAMSAKAHWVGEDPLPGGERVLVQGHHAGKELSVNKTRSRWAGG